LRSPVIIILMNKTIEFTRTHQSQRDRPFSSKTRTRKKHSGLGAALFMAINLLLVQVVQAAVSSCDPGYYLNSGKCIICTAGKYFIYYNNFRELLCWWHFRISGLYSTRMVHRRLQRMRKIAIRPWHGECFNFPSSLHSWIVSSHRIALPLHYLFIIKTMH
jgi:hypothetical protein